MTNMPLPIGLYQAPDGLRKFSSTAIQHAIDEQIGTLKNGEHYAFVATAVKSGDTIATKMSVMVKLDAGWSFGGFIEGDIHNPLQSYGAEIRFAR